MANKASLQLRLRETNSAVGLKILAITAGIKKV